MRKQAINLFPKEPWIRNKKEQNRMIWTTGLIVLFLLMMFFFIIPHFFPAATYHSRAFKGFFKNFGSLARILVFFVFAHYVLSFILRKKYVDRWIAKLKPVVITFFRWARQWHVPAAITVFGLVVIHAVCAFLYGWKWDWSNMTGLLALLCLVPIAVTGFMRYKKLDRKWHFRLGIGFAVLFILHAFL